jgi:glycosyl hydrolase family 26
MSRRLETQTTTSPVWTTRGVRLLLLAGLCLVVLSMGARWWALSKAGPTSVVTPTSVVPTTSLVPSPDAREDGPSLQRARAKLGPPPSGGKWRSGIWAGGGTARTKRVNAFGAWRGVPSDAVTQYPESTTWQAIHDSHWHVSTYAKFDGTLVYGLPMLPQKGSGDFGSIIKGKHDWVYRQVARDLVTEGRGRSIVRIGWEPNGNWFPWGATAGNAAQYVHAYRHIAGVLRAVAPNLVIDFDISCGVTLSGQKDRRAALTELYPGDDAVDIVGCDTFDWYNTKVQNEVSWRAAIRPVGGVGIADVADFARAHGKGLSIPEWGLASPADGGLGDNPFYIKKMRSFFEANADVLVLESYFSEPETSLANSIWDPVQNPRSSAVYARLW